MVGVRQLHETLAQIVLSGRDLDEVLSEITTIACGAIPGSEAASISLIRGEHTFTAAFDGQLALHADELQYERGYGPCLDAGRAGLVLVIDDMRTEQRWPDYAEHAAARGIGSSLSLPLPFPSGTIGALNTYASRPSAFDAHDVTLGEEVAAWVALVVGRAAAVAPTEIELEQLRAAPASRSLLEQAKGMLMERHTIGAEEAFTLLVRASQHHNLKLREVAAELVQSGVLLSAADQA
jgi:GAF domain-containing protein